MIDDNRILVVGATGNLGGKVVQQLLGRGKTVRALVRPGSSVANLSAQRVEIIRGDLTDPASLEPALEGVSGLITTAAGYVRHRKGDTLAGVDDQGNRNLIDAARNAGVKQFIFTSILTCDLAVDVPHFYQKKLIEDYLEKSGIPFVSLRPGGFLDVGISLKGISRGYIRWIGNSDISMTSILSDDVAHYLAVAVDTPKALGQRIDLGSTPAISIRQTAQILTSLLGRQIRVRNLPEPLLNLIMSMVGTFNPAFDFRSMFKYIVSGKYVADTTRQTELFGEAPTFEDSARRWLIKGGLLTHPNRFDFNSIEGNL